jgi:hypothetical protein
MLPKRRGAANHAETALSANLCDGMGWAYLLLVIASLLLVVLLGAQGAVKDAATPVPAAAAHADVRTFVGQIVAIDAAKGTMTIGESLQASRPKTAKLKESVTVAIDGGTQVFRGKRAATKEELKAHDHVVVRYLVTPQGARAVSCRASDTVARSPSPTAGSVPAGLTASGGASSTSPD